MEDKGTSTDDMKEDIKEVKLDTNYPKSRNKNGVTSNRNTL